MADNILRLRVESSEYDQKLKKAAEGIRHLAEVAHRGGGELTGLEKAELDYVKALGEMETKSRTAAGGVRELESVFKELTVVYNHLNDVEKQDEGGKALRASLEQIKQRAQEARTELEAASKSLQGAENSMKGGGGLFSGIGSKMEGALAVFGGNLMTKGVELAASAMTSLISETGDMIKQGVELAKQGEGIRIAFDRLGRGDIMDGLREATHGTVTDLELMKAAVKFNDFKLPLDELGTMLAFAQQKAKDTGQSVDFLVESIVNGLGRKSLMILDNLGLSATEIKERMKETGDMTKAVGAIIRDQMAAAGDYVETAADRAAQANVSLQNKMEELGRKFAPVEEASNQLWTSMKIGILDIIGGPLAKLLNGLTEAGRLKNMLNQVNGGGDLSKTTRQLSALRGSNFKNEKYSSQLAQYDQDIRVAEYLKNKYTKTGSMGGGLVLSEISRRFNVKIGGEEDIDNLISSLKTMRSEYVQGAKDIMKPVKPTIDTSGAEQNLDSLKKKLKELEAERRKAVKAGDNEMVDNLTKQINATKQNIGYLDPNALKTTTTKDLDEEQQVQQKINDLLKEALTADAHRQGEIRQQVAELQKQQEKYKDIKNLAQGILPKDKEAVFTIDGQLSEETKKNLRDIENVTIDDKTMTVTADTQEAMQKVQELIGQVSTSTLQVKAKIDGAPTFTMAQLEGMSFDNPMPTIRGNSGRAQDKLDLATAAFATGGTSNADFSNYISGIKNALSNANLGDELYTSMTEKLKDATTVSTLLQEMMERGLAGADLENTAQALKDKLLSPDGIDQEAVQAWLEQLNKQIEEAGGVGMKLNSETGEVSDNKDKSENDLTTAINKATVGINALSNINSGLKGMGIDLGEDIGNAIGIIQSMMTVIQGVQAIVSLFQTPAVISNTAALTALNTTLLVKSFLPGFANGFIVPHAAGGYVVPGNYFSGDVTPILANAGEVVLTKAQAGVVADALEGGPKGQIVRVEGVLRGSDIILAINNESQSWGQGTFITTK